MHERTFEKTSPRLARAFLERFLPSDIREPVIGDFEESFGEVLVRLGRTRATTWYWGQTFRSVFACLAGRFGDLYGLVYARFETAAQTLVRHRRYSLTTTTGLAIAFTCCILIALFVAHELSYDRYHKNSERIFRIKTQDGVAMPGPLGPALRQDIPGVERTTRLAWGVGSLERIRSDSKEYRTERRLFADGEVFEIFDWNLAGRNEQPVLDRPFSVVVCRSLAAALFGGRDAVGQTVKIDNHDFVVTGVMHDIRTNSYIRPDFIMSFSSLDSLLIYNNYTHEWIRSWGKGHSVTPTYVLLDDPKRAADAAGAVARVLDRNRAAAGYEDEVGARVDLQPLTDLYLAGGSEAWAVGEEGDPKQLVGMGVAVLLILLVAGINIINLVVTIWQADFRLRGFRPLERRKLRLFLRFFFESFLITVLALTFGLFAARLLLPLFASIVGRELLIQTALIPWIVLCSIPFALIIGAIAALNPDAFLSRRDVRIPSKTAAHREYHRTRHGRLLVAFQFVVAGVLVFSAASMISQTRFLKTMPLGFEKEDLLVVSYPRGAITTDQFQKTKKTLLALPGVESAAASYQLPDGCPGLTLIRKLGQKEPAKISSHLMVADDDFLDTYRIERLTRREDAVPSPDGWTFWLNRASVEALGWNDPVDAVGQDIESIGACNKDWHIVIGGVFENYQHCSIYHGICPHFICIPPEDTYWHITLRVQSETKDQAAAAVRSEWNRLHPNIAIEPYFLGPRLEGLAAEEYRIARQILLLAVIVLIIVLVGLSGLARYSIDQRKREIGAWLISGRNRVAVVARLTGSFVPMIFIALLIAGPIAYFATGRWLERFAAQVDLGAGFYLLLGGCVLFLSLLVVLTPAVRSVRSPKRLTREIKEIAYGR